MNSNPHLGELELAIMAHVWKRGGEVTVPDVHRHLQRNRHLAYTTVMTVMSRLHSKGVLERCEDSRPYRYRAAVSREDYSAGLMLGVLEEFGDRPAVLARFVERIGPRDAEILRKLAAKARRR
ncbi:MAG: BlaI/MecI/CopY family transcriptional regulator [Actinomycetota bacterium]